MHITLPDIFEAAAEENAAPPMLIPISTKINMSAFEI
jgi:hypothetical protein